MSKLSRPRIEAPCESPSGSLGVIDTETATFRSVLDERELVKHLEGLSSSQRWGTLRGAEIKVLRCRSAERCTFQLVVHTDLIGKVFAIDRRDVYEVMKKISDAGFGPEAKYAIPQPISYIPSLRLLLQERVEGVLAEEIFKSGDNDQRAVAAERCGRWMAQFHTLPPLAGRVSSVERYFKSSERKCRLMSAADGSLASQCEDVLERLKAAAPSPEASPICQGHGDFWERQIIFAGERTVVCDWDLYDAADPARDIAHFMMSLERMAVKHLGSARALDRAAGVFLETYFASGGNSQVLAHLPFYKAVHWLRGRKNVIETRAPGWRDRAKLMLDEALRSLSERPSRPVTLSSSRVNQCP